MGNGGEVNVCASVCVSVCTWLAGLADWKELDPNGAASKTLAV